MRLRYSSSSRLRRTQSLAVILAMAACQPLIKKSPNTASRITGVLALSEATAPAGVTQVQVVLLDEAKCKSPAPNQGVQPADIDVTTGSGSGTTGSNILQLTDGHKQRRKDYKGTQSGGWYSPGMFGHSGTLDQILAKLFGMLATTTINQPTINVTTNVTNNITNNITNNVYNTPVPAPMPIAEPQPAPVVAPSPTPAPSTDPAPISTVTPTADGGPVAAGGYVPADPSCVVMNIQQPYSQSETLNFHGIPVGSYSLLVLWEDQNGTPIQQGSSTVTITADKVAVANIVMQPVTTSNGGLSVNIVSGASKLAFLGTLPIAAPGVCTEVKVQTQDAKSGPAPLAANATLSFATSSAAGTFHTDNTCSNAAVVSVPLVKGATDLSVYYKDSTAGSPTLTVSSSDANLQLASVLMGASSQPVVSSPSKLAWSGAALTGKVNDCGALLALVQDANGQASSFTELRLLNVSSSSQTGTFFTDAACTTSMTAFNLAIGATQVVLYYKDSVAGSPTLSITDPSANGLAPAAMTATISN